MKKKLVIETCDQCPHFDNEYWGYEQACTILDRLIPDVKDMPRPIPVDCPLEDAD
jgi:hypothetical protein